MRNTTLFVHDWRIPIEVAETPEELRTGLGGRSTMGLATYGMLFPGTTSVWMFPMRFPLDMIFLRDNVVTRISANAPPGFMQTYADPTTTAVLELGAHYAARCGLAVGQRVAF